MDYDISIYIKAAVSGVPLLLVVNGLVWVWGLLGATGRWQLASSMGTGLALGVAFMVSQTRPPAGDPWEQYVYWFTNFVYGLGLGLLASGFYEVGKGIVAKAVRRLAEPPQ